MWVTPQPDGTYLTRDSQGRFTIKAASIDNAAVATNAAIAASKLSGVRASGNDYTARAAPAVDTSYRPSTTRDTEVVLGLSVTTPKGANGDMTVKTGPSDPPTETLVGQITGVLTDADGVNARSVTRAVTFTFTVKAGDYYRVSTTSNAGSPTFSFTSAREKLL